MYPDYLIHFNKNHSPKNGQFTSGDGDGDGISDDHAHRSKEGKKKGLSKKAKVGLAIAGGVVGTAAIVAGAIGIGKTISDANRQQKLSDATINGLSKNGKNWWDNSKSYQKVVLESNARQRLKEKWQPEGWDKDVSLKPKPIKMPKYTYRLANKGTDDEEFIRIRR